MKILAVGAHPDDIELFMFGLLSTYSSLKHKIFLAVVTDGRAGGMNPKKLIKIRRDESIQGLSSIGTPKFFDYEDGNLSQKNISLDSIGNYINLINPNLILTHSPTDYHPDHRIVSEYIIDFCSFRYPIIFSENMMGLNFNPDYYIDITFHFGNKEKAIKCHKSQNPTRLLELIKSMNSFRAMQCNLKKDSYVECYKLNKNFPFNDVSHLIPNTLKLQPFKLV